MIKSQDCKKLIWPYPIVPYWFSNSNYHYFTLFTIRTSNVFKSTSPNLTFEMTRERKKEKLLSLDCRKQAEKYCPFGNNQKERRKKKKFRCHKKFSKRFQKAKLIIFFLVDESSQKMTILQKKIAEFSHLRFFLKGLKFSENESIDISITSSWKFTGLSSCCKYEFSE